MANKFCFNKEKRNAKQNTILNWKRYHTGGLKYLPTTESFLSLFK